MNKDTLNKEKALDEKLRSAEGTKVAQVVSALPEEELSLAWRSQLNEKLNLATDKKRKKKTWNRIWSYSAGLGLSTVAGIALFLAILPNDPEVKNLMNSNSYEKEMLVAHHTAVRSTDIAGEGLSALDESELIVNGNNNEWKQEDLEAL